MAVPDGRIRPGKGSRFTLSLPDRQSGQQVQDIRFDYSGGFNRTFWPWRTPAGPGIFHPLSELTPSPCFGQGVFPLSLQKTSPGA